MIDPYSAFRQFERLTDSRFRDHPVSPGESTSSEQLVATVVYFPDEKRIEYRFRDGLVIEEKSSK
jgi:hypothetical protein